MSDNPNVAAALCELRSMVLDADAMGMRGRSRSLRAAIAALEAQASAPGGEVTDAAYRWWLSRRPLAFNEAEHLANPGINTCSDAEKALAKAVAAALAAPGGEVTDDPVEERFMDSLLDWLWKKGHGDESPQYQAAIALMLDRRQHIAALAARTGKGEGDV